MEMSMVMKYEVNDCAYNVDSCCHTLAITIVDGMHPRCDTFSRSIRKEANAVNMAGVGPCKVAVCKYNTNLECQAPIIPVGYGKQKPDCPAFESV